MRQDGDEMVIKDYNYPRLPNDEYYAAISEFKREAGKLISSTYSMHGYQDYHPHVLGCLVELAEQLGMRLRGKSQIIKLDDGYAKRYDNDID
jgi:hypothetical protein